MNPDTTLNQTPKDLSPLPIASPLKRILALSYDVFILGALSMLYSAIATVAMHFANKSHNTDYLPMQQGHWFELGWFIVLAGFYCFFWKKGGQTVGMKTWHIKLEDQHTGEAPNLIQCILRALISPFIVGACGLGYIWCFIDKEKHALHDRITRTRVVALPKPPKKKK